MDAAEGNDRGDTEVGGSESVTVGEQHRSTERRRGVPTRKARREWLTKRMRVLPRPNWSPALEDRLHAGVHDHRLHPGGNDRPKRRTLVVRTSSQRSDQRKDDPDQAEVAES